FNFLKKKDHFIKLMLITNASKKNKGRNNKFHIKEARFIGFFLNERNLRNKILIRKSEYLELP
ncbi:MAG TPA: hypothetical protein VLA74_01220, partial [Nitrososphaeraceae archaeon]|nr:hypothetical protein [Nitrososphaeraceae archaeon]